MRHSSVTWPDPVTFSAEKLHKGYSMSRTNVRTIHRSSSAAILEELMGIASPSVSEL